MKKLMINFGVFFLASLVLMSCGSNDPKKNGEKAGKIQCEGEELKEQMDDIREDIDDLDWDDDDEREEIADLEMDIIDLEKKMFKLRMEYISLENKKWTATEDEDDIDDWKEDFNDAEEKYIDKNCD